jgi:hypothetical protein
MHKVLRVERINGGEGPFGLPPEEEDEKREESPMAGWFRR